MEKLVILHPPFYPINYDFYHELGKLTNLCVFMFGDRPEENPSWHVADLYRPKHHSFRLKVFGRGCYPMGHIYTGCFLFALRREAPSTVLTIAFAPYGLYAAMFKKCLGYRLYLMSESNQQSEAKFGPVRRLYRSFLLCKCDGGISASSLASAYLKQLCPTLAVCEIQQTTDVQFYVQAAKKFQGRRHELRRELAAQIWQQKKEGSQTDPKTFADQFCRSSLWLSCGRLIPLKRWHWGLTLLKQHPGLQYILVGKGELASELKAEAESLGVAERFHLLPFATKDELSRYYNAADLLYFPSETETFGYVVAEALASGCPVLCSRHIGAGSLIEEGVNGWYLAGTPETSEASHQVQNILHALKENHQEAIRTRCQNSMVHYTLEARARGFYQIMYPEKSKMNVHLIRQEQGTRNKEQGTRNKEQGTRNKEQGTRNKEQGTRNKEQGTRNKEQGTRNKEQGTRNKEQGTRNFRCQEAANALSPIEP